MTTKTISDITKEVFDLRDIIELYEELEAELLTDYNALNGESERATDPEDVAFQDFLESVATDEAQEYRAIRAVLLELAGTGDDEQWRGDWYPVTMIAERHWVDYCEDLVKDIGDLPQEIPSYIVIDWEDTAENIRADYSEIAIEGISYYYRYR